ncbi:MAG: NusG domain II-containing protein [Sulfuriflexus sp.]|nr:NusG domain II-containing protein [Sulfuriflexus sp.]
MTLQNIISDFKLADKAVFLFSLSLIITSYFYFWQSTPASYAIIKSPQQKSLQVSLNENQLYNIQGALGKSAIEVKQGKIRFISSPCQNKFCIQHGWQQHHGNLTACLPNRISIQLANLNQTENYYDAINF